MKDLRGPHLHIKAKLTFTSEFSLTDSYMWLLNIGYLQEDVTTNLSPEHQSYMRSTRSTGLKVNVKHVKCFYIVVDLFDHVFVLAI